MKIRLIKAGAEEILAKTKLGQFLFSEKFVFKVKGR